MWTASHKQKVFNSRWLLFVRTQKHTHSSGNFFAWLHSFINVHLAIKFCLQASRSKSMSITHEGHSLCLASTFSTHQCSFEWFHPHWNRCHSNIQMLLYLFVSSKLAHNDWSWQYKKKSINKEKTHVRQMFGSGWETYAKYL